MGAFSIYRSPSQEANLGHPNAMLSESGTKKVELNDAVSTKHTHINQSKLDTDRKYL